MLAFKNVYEDKGRLNFYLIRDELTIGNFHENPLMHLTKSLRCILSRLLRSLKLGCQTSPNSRKGDFAGKILWVVDPC